MWGGEFKGSGNSVVQHFPRKLRSLVTLEQKRVVSDISRVPFGGIANFSGLSHLFNLRFPKSEIFTMKRSDVAEVQRLWVLRHNFIDFYLCSLFVDVKEPEKGSFFGLAVQRPYDQNPKFLGGSCPFALKQQSGFVWNIIVVVSAVLVGFLPLPFILEGQQMAQREHHGFYSQIGVQNSQVVTQPLHEIRWIRS